MKKIFLTFLAMVAMVGMVNAQRAWAYDLALAQEAEAYTFTFKATTAANATLIFTDVEGTELAAVELGAVEAGLNTKTLAVSELPQGKKVNWAVKMAGEAIVTGETLLEVTDQTRGIYDFYNMMDVLVDNNPESEYFSRIYIQMAFDGATDGATDRADTQTSGFFIYDQELNELNPTTNVGIKPTLPEGYNMGDNRNKFHRLDIDPKTGFLTWCYNMDAQPAVFAVDPANLAGDATNIVAGVTGLTRTAAHCYDEEGTLYIMDIADSKGAIYKIVDGQAVQLTEPTGKWVNASIALAADGKGGLWVAHNRGQMDTYYQLVHVTAAGELDYTVWADNTNGFEGGCLRGALAYDVERQILAQGRNGAVELYNVAYDAETGVPTLTKFAVTPTVGNNIDGLHFDYAGDLYVVNSSKEKFQKFVVPTDNNVCVVPAAAKHAFEIEAAPAVEIVGVVKRALQLGESVVVLTHEADGTPHIYNVVGETITEVSQEGVVACDPENKGDYLAISDIAATEDGKLVAVNYTRNVFAGNAPEDGYKAGTSYYYIWNELAADPAVWFTTQTTARSTRGDMGKTFAVKGTSDNAKILTTAVHNNNRAVRMALYSVIEGQYVEPKIADGEYNNDYYFCFGDFQKTNYYKEETQGAEYYLLASPLAEKSWIIEAELSEPSEFLIPEAADANYSPNQEIAAATLGNKYQGTTIVTVGEKHLMVAPYADAEGKLAGVKVLDITAGLASATEVAVANLEATVEATAAATAVAVDGELLTVTLVADATLHTLVVGDKPAPAVVEDTITNLVFDYESTAFIGGPSEAYQVEVFLVLGEDKLNGTWTLSEETAIAVDGEDAIFIEGTVSNIDLAIPTADAVIVAEVGGQLYEFHLNMIGGAPEDAIVIEVADANIKVNKSLLFSDPIMGDMYDYSLTITADWTYAEDGLTYPILVEVPVYYPEATEPSDIPCAVTVGNIAGNWLGFAEGELTITTAEGVVTVKGIVANSGTGVAFDLTISGKLPVESAVDNVVVDGNIVKTFENGQLVIIKNGVKVNASGAVVK